MLSPFELSDEKNVPSAIYKLADALLERVKGAQFVLAGHWGDRSGERLPCTREPCSRQIEFTTNPAWLKLTGSQIKQFLREALKAESAARLTTVYADERSACHILPGAIIRQKREQFGEVEISIRAGSSATMKVSSSLH